MTLLTGEVVAIDGADGHRQSANHAQYGIYGIVKTKNQATDAMFIGLDMV